MNRRPIPEPNETSQYHPSIPTHPQDGGRYGFADLQYWNRYPWLIGLRTEDGVQLFCERRQMENALSGMAPVTSDDIVMWSNDPEVLQDGWLYVEFRGTENEVRVIRLDARHMRTALEETSKLSSYRQWEILAPMEQTLGE